MDLNDIFVFAKVVEAGGFSAAARELGMPKSTVSRKVADLEARLGARLLQRTTRKLSVTDVGRTYYQYAARAVEEIESGEQAVAALEEIPRGQLRVSAPLDLKFLGPVFSEFLARYPDVQLDLVCTDRVVHLVDEGFDLALRVGRLSDSSLIARKLTSWRGVVLSSPRYLKQKGKPSQPEDLVKHDCLVFGSGLARRRLELVSSERTAEVEVTPRLVTNDLSSLEDALRAGLGIAVLPAFRCVDELQSRKLRQVMPGWSSPAVPLQAVYPSTRHVSPKVSRLVELLQERLGGQPWSMGSRGPSPTAGNKTGTRDAHLGPSSMKLDGKAQ